MDVILSEESLRAGKVLGADLLDTKLMLRNVRGLPPVGKLIHDINPRSKMQHPLHRINQGLTVESTDHQHHTLFCLRLTLNPIILSRDQSELLHTGSKPYLR